MNLNILWFVLIGILYTGYFVLEGFDFGVGILHVLIGKDDTQRRVILNTIGSYWDGNEVWLISAGGATFAAFPQWYATLFSGFYLPLFLILIALILRGAALEFRSRVENLAWRRIFGWAIFVGSLLPALLWGVAFANIVRGVPIDASMQYTGGFWNLLNPFALIAGVVSLFGFTLHGAIFISLRTTGEVRERAKRYANGLWIAVILAALALTVSSYTFGGIFTGFGLNGGILLLLGLAVLIVLRFVLAGGSDGWAFALSAIGVILFSSAIFVTLFPNVMVSSTAAANNLTIYNAASGPYTLALMSKIALVLVPLVLLYQGWTYWTFRKRVSGKPEELHY